MSALTVSKCSSRRVVYNQVSVDTSCVVSILLVYSIVTGDCSLLWSGLSCCRSGVQSAGLAWPALPWRRGISTGHFRAGRQHSDLS